MSGDPTADAGIDLGHRFRDKLSGDRFTIDRTYRDNPINPGFRIVYDPPSEGWYHRGANSVTLAYITAYCERIDD